MKHKYLELAILVVCFLASSCGEKYSQQDWSKPKTSDISLSCKAQINADEFLVWPSSTKIGLYCEQTGSNNAELKISAATAGTDAASFHTDIAWSDTRHSFIAYYPYAAAAKTGFIAGSLSSNVSRGESVDALYSKNTYIGSADSEKTDEPVEIMMTPLLDICKIIVKQTKYSGYNLDRISIKTKSGNGISGKWEYEVAGKKFTFTEPSDEMNINFSSISLSNTDIEAFMLAYNSAALSEEAEFEVSLAKEKVNITLHGEGTLTASTELDLDKFRQTIVGDDSINLADPDNDGVQETANCYIVPEANKTYRFPATVMGNGKTLPADESVAAAPGIIPSPLSPKSAKLLWQTSSSLISNVKLNNDCVYFTLNGDESGNFIPGNAVIAIYSGEDCSGSILWSWHLWITDANLDAQLQTWKVHSSLDSYSSYQDPQLMDRNLGALSNSDWKTSGNNLSKGLNYQWGRKDPFFAPDNSSMSSTKIMDTFDADGKNISTARTVTEFSNAAEWTYISKKINKEDIAKYPMTFVIGKNVNTFWMAETEYDLWGCPAYADNTNNIGQKTIYDPCPPGYRVMNAYAMSGVTSSIKAGKWANLEHDVKNATTFNKSGEDLQITLRNGTNATLPASGMIAYEAGGYSRTGGYGNLWSAKGSAGANKAYRVAFDYANYRPMDTGYASYGHNVRCERIK